MKADIIIIGSGIGGLLCGAILAKKGKRVCIIEKNKQLGGNLQTFSRDKQIFDTGVHYIGGLDEGQNLYQIFKYAEVIPQLRLAKMDTCFDHILLENDATIYPLCQGYEAFIQSLIQQFPKEKKAVEKYCALLKQACRAFPLYNLQLSGDDESKLPYITQSAKAIIASITNDDKLQAVLAGNNILYNGIADKTPFHVHALITNSYIESSWKCVDGGSQIAKLLAATIRKYGGIVLRNQEVKKIVETGGIITHIETAEGQLMYGEQFISNIHPAVTLELTQSNVLKKLYQNRIRSLRPTISSFSLHIVLKENSLPYKNHNYYFHKTGHLWNMNDYTTENWPLGYGLYFTPNRKNPAYAATISILTPMRFEEVANWQHTCNRVGNESLRGRDYELFKKEKAEKLLDIVQLKFPGIRAHILKYYTSTPLTNRDYIGDKTGAMYGTQKDYRDPLKTMISPRTKIANLFLTGQNLNLHGILGTSLSAILTCTMVLKNEGLIEEIRNA